MLILCVWMVRFWDEMGVQLIMNCALVVVGCGVKNV